MITASFSYEVIQTVINIGNEVQLLNNSIIQPQAWIRDKQLMNSCKNVCHSKYNLLKLFKPI